MEPCTKRLLAAQGAHQPPGQVSRRGYPDAVCAVPGPTQALIRDDNVQRYPDSGCGGEFIRTSTWSHDGNRNSRNVARTAPQNSRRDPNPARTC